jgi:hypothetical protein
MQLFKAISNLALSLRKNIPGYHSFWTEPMDNVALSDPEIACLIAGALYYKQHSGPMHLITDQRGYEYLSRLKILSLYDSIRELKVPRTINPKIFWAAGKIFAHRMMPCPSTSIDMDAVLWRPMPLFTLDSAIALHTEPKDWPHYATYRPEFNGPWDCANDEDVVPVNTGVLSFRNEALKTRYINMAVEFMEEHSRRNTASVHSTGQIGSGYVGGQCFVEMVYAEQTMLSVAAGRQHGIGTIVEYDRFIDHVIDNPIAMHLWNSKRGYLLHEKARETFVQNMISIVARDFPRAKRIIRGSGLAEFKVRDGNLGSVRYSKVGDWTLPGEEQESL